ncbi:hypothetical protein LMG7974_00040 [Campylobacter majalis]|uniref:Uroporphyrinogen-III synthase n=1 Tax=Campylobacter majalis TaxID=2790656 RepID=A0ABM8Q1I8_9BACT|nr:uroporphyrinogen-III synthase [Campylobacter majalis]CAD7286700.1 hypothetical protein LMG7974_00040 [Campylobacter majalis]
MIYLINHENKYEGVENLVLNEICYFNFSLDLNDFDALIITSKNSINALKFNEILPTNINVYSIGEQTSKFANEYGFCNVYTAKNHHGDEFANEIIKHLYGKKTVFVRAKQTASKIDEILTANAIDITTIVAYENIYKNLKNLYKPPKNSILIFLAPSGVQNFLQRFGWDDSYWCIAIGNTTASALKFTNNLKISKKQTINDCILLAKTLL